MNALTTRARWALLLLAVALTAWAVTPMVAPTAEVDLVPIAQEDPAAEGVEEEGSLEDALLELPVETYQVFLARDPFQPIVPPTADGGTGDGGTGGTGGTGGSGTDGSGGTDGGGTGGTGGGDACTTGSNAATCEGITVTLLDVMADDGSGERAIVQVEDTLYEVAEGAIFAGSFEVLSIDAPCATLLYGDDAFTLCEGDRVLK